MARLLSAQAGSDFTHALQHITVAHLSLFHLQMFSFSHFKEAKITHYGSNNGVFFQLALISHMGTHNSHNLVAVDNCAVFVHRKKPVGIPVKSQAYMSLFVNNSGLQLFHMSGSAVGIDVRSIRHIVYGNHIGPQLPECFYGSVVGSALRTVNNNFQLR